MANSHGLVTLGPNVLRLVHRAKKVGMRPGDVGSAEWILIRVHAVGLVIAWRMPALFITAPGSRR